MIHVGTRSGRSPRAARRKISFLVEDGFAEGMVNGSATILSEARPRERDAVYRNRRKKQIPRRMAAPFVPQGRRDDSEWVFQETANDSRGWQSFLVLIIADPQSQA